MSTDNHIEKYFQETETNLPSNFPWLVMQRIVVVKIKQARQKALFETGLIGLGALLGSLVLVFAYSLYAGALEWQIPLAGTMALPALGILALFVILDSGLQLRERSR